MKNFSESLLAGDHPVQSTKDLAATLLVGRVNKKRQPKGGKTVMDTWGNPVQPGDCVIGVTDGKPEMTDVKFQSTSNLVVGRVAEIYNGGISVIVCEPSGLGINWGPLVKRCEALGGVPAWIRIKSGFIKVDEETIRKIFKV